ncbi:MAG: hypothetical protein LBH80_04285 [Prevotellaceae bacterium]|nr:hypothetical protein [Prevotellaceae bacterium]
MSIKTVFRRQRYEKLCKQVDFMWRVWFPVCEKNKLPSGVGSLFDDNVRMKTNKWFGGLEAESVLFFNGF